MAKVMASVSAHKGKNKKEIRHMSIRPADNGFISETHYKEPPRKMDEPWQEPESDQCVHPSVQHLADHIHATFGGKKKESAKHEAGESKAFEKGEEAEGDDEG